MLGLWMDVPSAEALACARMTKVDRYDEGAQVYNCGCVAT